MRFAGRPCAREPPPSSWPRPRRRPRTHSGEWLPCRGGTVVVGKPGAARGPAALYRFERDGSGAWVLAGMFSPPGTAENGFRLAPSIQWKGERLVVGSADPDVRFGAHLFQDSRNGPVYEDGLELRRPQDPELAANPGGPGGAAVDFAGIMRILQPPVRTVALYRDRVAVSVAAGGSGPAGVHLFGTGVRAGGQNRRRGHRRRHRPGFPPVRRGDSGQRQRRARPEGLCRPPLLHGRRGRRPRARRLRPHAAARCPGRTVGIRAGRRLRSPTITATTTSTTNSTSWWAPRRRPAPSSSTWRSWTTRSWWAAWTDPPGPPTTTCTSRATACTRRTTRPLPSPGHQRSRGARGNRLVRHHSLRGRSAGLRRCVDGLPLLRERHGGRHEHVRRGVPAEAPSATADPVASRGRGAGRIRTAEWRFCRPLPYHLATAPTRRGRPATAVAPQAILGSERETGLEPATPTLARWCSTN